MDSMEISYQIMKNIETFRNILKNIFDCICSSFAD